MASLDVSDVINDPLFASEITMIKVSEGTDGVGNPLWTPCDPVMAKAVVTSDMRVIERLPEAIKTSGTILVRVRSKDIPEGFGKGFDTIVWRGRRFVIKDKADYSHFGRGMIRFVCAPEEVADGGY